LTNETRQKKKHFEKKAMVISVISATTISWIQFDMMNQIIEGTTKANDTPNNHGYGHVESFQPPIIKEHL
jgi:hypothetical protein